MKYGLSDEQLKQIQDIISSYDEIEEAILFGSRAIDTYKEASDVDIAIKGKNVTASLAAKLKYRFEEDTYLPFFFDFVAYPTITNEALKKHIDKKGVSIYRAGWKKFKIIDVISLEYGKGLNNYREGIGNYDVFGTNGRIGVTEQFLYDQQSIIIGRKGAYREIHLAKKPFFVIDTAFYTKKKTDDLDTLFLYYWFKAIDINQMDSGSAIPSTSRDEVYDLDILLPPPPEQKAIASVLSSLDDKIDLLHRQNKTLETMAETLFRQWFVEESQEDWEEVTLGECCRVITKGTTPTTLKKAFVSSGINFIKVNCIDENGNFLADKFEYIDEETNELLSRSKLEEGDILYSIAGTIGRLIIVSKDILPANVNQALAILRINSEKINPVFIKYCLKDREITENLHSKVVHAVQPNLSLGEISKTIVPFPPNELLNDFVRIVEPIESNLLKNKTQIRTLEKLRDRLLPKLMSGEVKVDL